MSQAIALLVQHGYLVLFTWVLVEQLGAPLPSSPLMLAAGALSTSGRISAVLSIAAVVLGCVVSDTTWFLLGRKYGDRLVRIICMISLEPATCVRKTENAMSKYGGKTLLFAKFVPGLNVVAAPIAGQSELSLGKFLALDITGALAWSTTFVVLGRILGESVASTGLSYVAKRFAVLLFAAVIIGLVVRRIVRKHAFVLEARKAGVTPKELKARLDRGENFHIVDLRPKRKNPLENQSLPGALRLTAEQVLAALDQIPRDRDVVLFCGCPGEASAVALAIKLRRHGIDRVHPLHGGVEVWRKSGYPLV